MQMQCSNAAECDVQFYPNQYEDKVRVVYASIGQSVLLVLGVPPPPLRPLLGAPYASIIFRGGYLRSAQKRARSDWFAMLKKRITSNGKSAGVGRSEFSSSEAHHILQ